MKKIICLIGTLLIGKFMVAQEMIYTKFYYPDSIVSSEGWMRDGKPDGYWKSYYSNGNLRSEGNRKDFLLDSLWLFYNDKGVVEMSIYYQEGKKNGIRRIYTDEEIIENTFIKDTIQGFENHYDKYDHLIMSIPYVKGLQQGISKEYDTLGNIVAITEYNKGYIIKREYINRTDNANRKQGSWKYFWANGNLKMEGFYVNDKKNGFFKYYNEDGVFQQIEKWQNDQLMEDAVETKKLEKNLAYYPNGKIKTEAFFYKGNPEGIRREYDSNGVIIQSYIFKNARLTGEGIVDENGWKQGYWKEFYEESGATKAAGNYKNNKPVGDWKYFFSDSTIEIIGSFTKKGEKDGEWLWYYPDGKLLMIENYANGLYEGVVVSFNEKGDTLFLGKYKEGMEDGRFKYVNDSVIEESFYIEGQRFGDWKTFYANGQLKMSAHFENDLQEGKTFFYWENGRKKMEYNYVNGLLNGYAFSYDEEGNHLFTTTYNMGVEIEYGGVKVTPELDK